MNTETKAAHTEDLLNIAEILVWLAESGNLASPIKPHPYGIGVMDALHKARVILKAEGRTP